MKRLLSARTSLFAALMILAGAFLPGIASAQSETDQNNNDVHVQKEEHKGMFVTLPPRYREDLLAPSTSTVPTWTGYFTNSRQNYRYTMVGTSPKTTDVSTTVTVFIVPIKMVYSNGSFDPEHVLSNGQTVVENAISSPVFQSSKDFAIKGKIDLGKTQYIDAFQRANFWNLVSAKSNYHVLLSQPTVLPEQTITVPARYGTISTEFGVRVGLADINFFDSIVQQIISGNTQIQPNTLPIFVTYDVYLTQGGNAGCCIGGYHSATGSASAPQTYAHFTYIDQTGAFSEDTAALSHEIGEWVNDPFINNNTPCGLLEVGDPLVAHDYAYTVNGFTYHLQDLAFLPYFTLQKPSSSVNGWYSFQNEFIGPCK